MSDDTWCIAWHLLASSRSWRIAWSATRSPVGTAISHHRSTLSHQFWTLILMHISMFLRPQGLLILSPQEGLNYHWPLHLKYRIMVLLINFFAQKYRLVFNCTNICPSIFETNHKFSFIFGRIGKVMRVLRPSDSQTSVIHISMWPQLKQVFTFSVEVTIEITKTKKKKHDIL